MILSKPHTTQHIKDRLRDESGEMHGCTYAWLQRQTCFGESTVVGRHMSVEKGKSTKIGNELGNTDHLYLEFLAQQLWQECGSCDSKKVQSINNPKFKDACKWPRDEIPRMTKGRFTRGPKSQVTWAQSVQSQPLRACKLETGPKP